ncbi:hypothetical protein [Deinococcus multiflagellatus]|uniref:HEAT repeat domain-containing protein n=1 Tax=Deinococcus multiflagellatus TaxID=1656887 RepID=A0ABW1ZV21_9DEIO|nr:hypothetical protein [Deinococcus multiflagellatus]MBZ9714515.1 hypothetical protein [Deinococcus multiflagellatus]
MKSNSDKFFPGFQVPALIAPTQEHVDKYTNPEFNYGAYLRDLRERGPREGGVTQLENIITQCIEGEFTEALAALQAYPSKALTETQRVAYFRLMGGLFATLGDDEQARACIAQALTLSQALTSSPHRGKDHADASSGIARGQVQALRKFLRRDLSMQLEMLDPFDDGQFHRYEAARKIDAPPFLGYQEYARAIAGSYMVDEEYRAVLRSETSRYHRSGLPSEIAWANLAMWMAYTCGDSRRGHFVRALYARWAVVHGRRIENHQLVAEGVKELIRCRVTDLKELFDQVGHLVHARIDVNAYFQNFRPLKPDSRTAEPMWRILNAMVTTMVGYADEASLTALRQLYRDGLQRFMAGQAGLAAGTSFSATYFIEAFRELEPQLPDLELLLPWLEERAYGPGHFQNLWLLFDAFDWKNQPEAAPLAARAVHLLKTLYPKGESDAYATLLSNLSDGLPPDERQELDRWVVDHLPPNDVVLYLANGHAVEAGSAVFKRLHDFLEPHLAELRAMDEEGPVSFGGPIVPSYVSSVFHNYQGVNANEARLAIIEDYLDALRNPQIHARHKLDAYRYLAEALRVSPPEVRGAVRGLVGDRSPMQELSRGGGQRFFSSIEQPLDAQMALLLFRAVVGLSPSQDDLRLLTQALSSAAAFTRKLAVEATTTALREAAPPDDLKLALASQLYARTFDDNAGVRERAVTGLIYSGLIGVPTWQMATVDRAATLIQQDQPYVGARILRAVAEEATRLTEISGLERLLSVGQVNAHQAVREAAQGAATALQASKA